MSEWRVQPPLIPSLPSSFTHLLRSLRSCPPYGPYGSEWRAKAMTEEWGTVGEGGHREAARWTALLGFYRLFLCLPVLLSLLPFLPSTSLRSLRSLPSSIPYGIPLRGGGVRGTERDEHRQQERDGNGRKKGQYSLYGSYFLGSIAVYWSCLSSFWMSLSTGNKRLLDQQNLWWNLLWTLRITFVEDSVSHSHRLGSR